MAECDQLAKIGQTILEGSNNASHLEWTQKQFNEYCSFNITTGSDSKGISKGFEGMPFGSADDFHTAIKDLFTELSYLMLPQNKAAAVIEEKSRTAFGSIKNVQSDHHIVNRDYFKQLQINRAPFYLNCTNLSSRLSR